MDDLDCFARELFLQERGENTASPSIVAGEEFLYETLLKDHG